MGALIACCPAASSFTAGQLFYKIRSTRHQFLVTDTEA